MAVVVATTEVGAVGVGVFEEIVIPFAFVMIVDAAIVVSVPPGSRQTLSRWISFHLRQ